MSERFSVFNPPRDGEGRVDWPLLEGLPLALAISSYAGRKGGPVLVAVPDGYAARHLRDDINQLGTVDAELFSDWEILPYDLYSPHPDLISRRLDLLSRLPGMDAGVVIAPITALMQRLPPVAWVQGQSLNLAVGERIDSESFRARLHAAGYQVTEQVWQPGQFAIRGAVMDLWPMGRPDPYRLELFDDEIESIRTFDAESQRSTGKLERIDMLPAREYPFDEDSRQAFRRAFRNRFDVDLRRALPYQEVGEGHHSQGLEQYLPLFFEATSSLTDYLPSPHRLLLLPGVEDAARDYWHEVEHRREQRGGDIERPVLDPGELFVPAADMIRTMEDDAAVKVTRRKPAAEVVAPAPTLDLDEKAEDTARKLRGMDDRVMIAADTAGRRELIRDALRAGGLRPKLLDSWSAFLSGDDPLAVVVMPVSGGCRLGDRGITVLTESELFPGHTRTVRRERRTGQDPESMIKSLADLQPGALVVHLEHGIGRYLGLEVLDAGDTTAEYLCLEYAGGDKLYVPVTDLHLVSRYTGADPDSIDLHKLSSDRWARTRRKAAEKVRDAAAELLNLQARRAARQGQSYELERGLYARFAAGFEYEETEDQQDAIDAVLADLASTEPMDRVVCGDVGFGKTEVALRAAFVVANSGRQVAMLAPTTLLAEQHYRNFADRFADWPVKVRLLSRTGAAAGKTLEGLRDGTVDIVIGTHRLLQKDIKFKELGLVIIDEEQRFGVRQKERLKALRAEVDLLTLTATPIPRTLNMSMAGLRELSIIATPPAKRLAVRTFVSEWDSAAIRDAVSREFQRGGQVYFLHNEVRTMARQVAELEEMFPNARIGMAHGQMPPGEMEKTMRDFYSRRINLLVCSTIIENGIDVPTANTIIINRADKFGLAQLHQLRGRVGRSHHLAYAYLITPPWKVMTRDAKKRLEAIQTLEELGAGFTLASHDLEIRGAGELLGEDQSGQIEAIGFALYSDLLNRAVEALKNGEEPDLDEPMSITSEVDLHITAMIPEGYLPDVHQRLVLYKRISQADTDRKLNDLQVEMIDRFGLLPQEVKNLFATAELRLRAKKLGMKRLEVGPAGGRVEFQAKPDINMGELLKMIQKESHTFELPANDRLRIKGEFEEIEDRFHLAEELLERLAPEERQAA
ncbi:transcription-repair coupling factor [Wenzhouxiangella sediminis]|uniref:Transcription-repair-coupling factor n=1 Tax=Wenzhouxiangella sediminis TaxID=1792836 RepID=A0A3E1KC27_9GAMM|nr:transcription-repair coupling factor [Wenzhouxiangella sediminis]RFF32259.1 transcription-repair coupling factor [Wenzhouxiangella sediminis]